MTYQNLSKMEEIFLKRKPLLLVLFVFHRMCYAGQKESQKFYLS